MFISDFRSQEAMRLIRFVKHWREKHETNPELYPLELEPGDWDEQYMAWKDTDR